MKCPACGRILTPGPNSGCPRNAGEGGCAGLWFDGAASRKIDGLTEAALDSLTNIPRDPAALVDPTLRRRCPRCPDIVLMRHYSSARRAVVVDECPTCAGLWLDAGELEAM